MTKDKYFHQFRSVKKVSGGVLGDCLYHVETLDNSKLFLRIFDASKYSHKKEEFEALQALAAHDVPVNVPIEVGVFDNGDEGYMLFNWIDGVNLLNLYHEAPKIVQYYYGVRAGELLARQHSVSIPADAESLGSRLKSRINKVITKATQYDLYHESSNRCLQYIEESLALINNRPQSFLHIDNSPSNILLVNGDFVFIDYELLRIGDPWEDLCMSLIHIEWYPLFYIGRIHGYFSGDPPESFWELRTIYALLSTLEGLFLRHESNIRPKYTKENVDNLVMQTRAPYWYQNADNLPLKLALQYRVNEISYVKSILSSGSWRITKPLRFCTRIKKKIKNIIRSFCGEDAKPHKPSQKRGVMK